MKFIIGLGNPGDEYLCTRHNFGFLFLDYIAEKTQKSTWKKEFDALTLDTYIDNEKVKLVKPQTYMNLSGTSVSKIKNYYKVENSDIIIVYDDIDLEFGNIRYREKGSAGTHNGMKSIVSLCDGENINRIRLGIGKPKYANQDLADFVLSKFEKEEKAQFGKIFDETYIKLKAFLDK